MIAAAANVGGGDTLVPLLVAMAGSGVLVAIIQGLFTRRKTRAEIESTGATATKMITDAAAGVVSNLQADNVSLRAEQVAAREREEKLLRKVAQLEHWQEAAEHNMERHEAWDARVAAQLRAYIAAPVDDPPPLRPVRPHTQDAT